MSNPAVEVSRLTKQYRIGERERYPTLRESLMRGASASLRRVTSPGSVRREAPSIWALRGVDLEVEEGEVLGIIGRNGSGKTTLLKVLSGITDPTSGYADIHGRVGSLLEVGTGFHMELTGRENIFMNGALLGMRRREIMRKFDEIVAFSEVETFLDTPVKRYSSGMFMRLAFAVAAHLEPEILMVDEVLAVGDAAFQRKCLGKMSRTASEGRTVLFVSHNMAAVQSLCTRAAWLDHGTLVQVGPPRVVIGSYLQSTASVESVALEQREDRSGDGSARLTSVKIESTDPDKVIRCGSRLRITIRYAGSERLRFPRFRAEICDYTNVGICGLDSEVAGGLPDLLPAAGAVECLTAPLNVTPGRCSLNLRLNHGELIADYVTAAAEFDIESDDFFGTGKLPGREWSIGLLSHSWSTVPDPTAP
jgi:lipopolysaccharide transport system ATP-binding protein